MGVSQLAVQLYTHSDYSLLESALTVSDLVQHGARLGFGALALTDRHCTGGHWEFARCCEAAGLKPIFGLELDVPLRLGLPPGQVVLLAIDEAGYGNLLRLASMEPPVRREAVLASTEGLALLEGGTTGAISALVAAGQIAEAQALNSSYLEAFGDRYFLRQEAGQAADLRSIFPEARFVLCQDVRYADPAATETLTILAAVKGTDPRIPPLPMLSWEELCRQTGASPEDIANTLELADRCRVQLPRFAGLSSGAVGEDLEKLAWQGARRRFGEPSPAVVARLEQELSVITELGFADYFLIVADLVRYAKTAGIPVGPGRGSAAGSLTAYVLGITEVNPLEWGLVFERFLNRERKNKPDIDVDFCYERRGEVLAHAVERFGRDFVAQIGTYGTFGSKGAAQEVRRVLGRDDPQIAATIQGLKRHRSTHAAGIIVSTRPVQEVTAVYTDRAVPVTHLDMYGLEDLGALKIDLLGLRTLTLLRNMEAEVQRRVGDFSLDKVPLRDEQTLALLGRGQTLGIFQLESSLFKDLLRKLKPQSFDDIVALLALGRPGPLSMLDEFAARRRDPGRITYIHPSLEEILGETYGLILYQEQVMTIAHRLGGLSLGEADLLRRDLAEDDPKALESWGERFVQGALEKGLSRQLALKLFKSIAQFSGYAFNKAHSVSYALLSWRAAYLKAHFPEVFFAVLLNHGGTSKEHADLLSEAKAVGVEILPPSVLHSEVKTSLAGKALRLGLTATRQLTPHSAREIVDRRQRRAWASWDQFKRDAKLERSQLETLIHMGALDELGERNQLLAELGIPPRSGLELLKTEKELLGVYVSSHPCTPFRHLTDRLRGELDAAVGEVLSVEVSSRQCRGVLDTPEGPLPFAGPAGVRRPWLDVGSRTALFGRQTPEVLEMEWALPLGPILLITPRPADLETIKGILQEKRGTMPAILLLGEAYHVLPEDFWVSEAHCVSAALKAQGIVFTWFDPWKEGV